jgi:hypothetical protein
MRRKNCSRIAFITLVRSDRACILDLSSIRRRRCDPCLPREDHELHYRCRTHLLHHAPAMDLDRPLGCAELRSNLFVEPAGNYALSTSNSRGVSVASRSRTSLRCERWSHTADDRSRARLTALRRFSSWIVRAGLAKVCCTPVPPGEHAARQPLDSVP